LRKVVAWTFEEPNERVVPASLMNQTAGHVRINPGIAEPCCAEKQPLDPPFFAGGTSITSHSLTFVHKHLHRRFGLRFHDFVDEKQVCKQGAEMDGSVQIVNQLGTDGGLG